MTRRLAFLLAAGLLCAVPAQAQRVCGGPMSCLGVAQTWTAQQTFSSPILLPNGTEALPAWAFASDTDTGMYWTSLPLLRIVQNGTWAVDLRPATFWIRDRPLGFSSGDAVADAMIGRDAAATLQLGADVNGSAVAQTLKAHDGITGSDIAGANLTDAGGRGTGAGAGGNRVTQTAPELGTGTTAQTLTTREIFVAKAKTLTESSATSIVQIAVPAEEAISGELEYLIYATDGATPQARTGRVIFSATADAAVETCILGTPEETDNTPTGTLTVTVTCDTAPTQAVDLALNAVSSLVQTVLKVQYQLRVNATATATVTPQ